MQALSQKIHAAGRRKTKVLQFGEGNFLRAFADWIIQKMNKEGVFEGGVAVVQPVPEGRIEELKKQDGLYTLLLEGIDGSKTVKQTEIIECLNDFINPYTEYQKFLSYAENEDLEIIISNTTEAGIALVAADTDFSVCPVSFPGKLLAFLHHRYKHFKGDKKRGLGIIPCELIDNNGAQLQRVLNELAAIKGLDGDFLTWLNGANSFTDTLVDRIVTGYPKDRIAEIEKETGYTDNSVVAGEIFHLWVLGKNEMIEKRFPAHKCGLNVIFVEDIKPYKERKVKILNGSHTALVPLAYLSGFDTVGEAVNDKRLNAFLRALIFSEINPTINLPENEMKAFAESVLERFKNPFIRHELLSIALNSTTKFRTRLLPTLTDFVRLKGTLPPNLCKAFAAFILFHRGLRGEREIVLRDDAAYLEKWKKAWSRGGAEKTVAEVCSWKDVWGEDLSQIHSALAGTVAGHLKEMMEKGVYNCL